ncbi:MAG: 3-deoxy-8-phosphooctulonate synthase [Alphaproteobacteria bacterium]|nr:3-deoxy-8-phosphooctulonate synthase [Alphaproteobacteria bacterium]
MIKHVEIAAPAGGVLAIGNDLPLTFMIGPNTLESRDHAMEMSAAIKEIADKYKIGVIYKSSFDKANRSSINSSRGIGMDKALPIFADIREKTGMPVITDIHDPAQCAPVAEAVDVLQIPAFLCRQTDLLFAAGQTGRAINIKKGQFLAPEDMKNVAAKIASTGNEKILLCERGVSFGYHALTVDMRSFPIMAQTGYPVVYDVTHSVQQPGGQGDRAGGQREFVPHLARAAVAAGIATLFIEIYPDPDKAPCDGPSATPLKDLPKLIETLVAFDKLAKQKA